MTYVLLRRVTALLAMVAIIALLMLLMWDVYLHHKHLDQEDEPAVVTLRLRVA
jgi:hypothetical protein